MQFALNGFQGSLLGFFAANPLAGLGFGPLWFVEALLFFAIAFMAWRSLALKPAKAYGTPKNHVILLFGLMLGAVTFVTRLVFPVGYVFDLLNFQLPFFPQYIALFVVGIIGYRNNWIQSILKSTGSFWVRVAILLLALLPIIIIVGGSNGYFNPFYGGMFWQPAAYAFWEQLFCVAVVVGLTVFFRERLNTQNRFTKALSDSSYTAYILQAPILIYLALALKNIQMPLAKIRGCKPRCCSALFSGCFLD